MNAAIYARKSTEQNVAAESKSVTRQEMVRTGDIFTRLDEAGVAVWGYMEDRCLT